MPAKVAAPNSASLEKVASLNFALPAKVAPSKSVMPAKVAAPNSASLEKVAFVELRVAGDPHAMPGKGWQAGSTSCRSGDAPTAVRRLSVGARA